MQDNGDDSDEYDKGEEKSGAGEDGGDASQKAFPNKPKDSRSNKESFVHLNLEDQSEEIRDQKAFFAGRRSFGNFNPVVESNYHLAFKPAPAKKKNGDKMHPKHMPKHGAMIDEDNDVDVSIEEMAAFSEANSSSNSGSISKKRRMN